MQASVIQIYVNLFGALSSNWIRKQQQPLDSN